MSLPFGVLGSNPSEAKSRPYTQTKRTPLLIPTDNSAKGDRNNSKTAHGKRVISK